MFAFILLMAAIVNTALAGFTVTYNGVQFGGSDATYSTTPPTYEFSGDYRFDESGRAVVCVDYILTLRSKVYGATESAAAINVVAIRKRLAVPGGLLKIEGLGTGFGTISVGGNNHDVSNGPIPLPLVAVPLGQAMWEITWAVKFSISECLSGGEDALAFMAFNFSTTWRNDFEGLTDRTITGHVIIPQIRNYVSPKTVLHVAEETRGNIVVAVPPNFQRTMNDWRESDDKSRLEFTIVDSLIDGDYLPPGITDASGSFGFTAGDGTQGGSGMASGMAVMSCSFKTAINQPRTLAGQIFIIAALAKQSEIIAALATAKTSDPTLPSGLVVPVRLSVANGKFKNARQTDCMMSWVITQSLGSILNASGIWTPVAGSLSPNDYTTWRASMSALWGNRGFSGIGSTANEAVIIDLCDNVTSKTIGVVGSSPNSTTPGSLDTLTCPSVPSGGGWIHFDLDVQLVRQDQQTLHKKAAAYLPASPSVGDTTDPLLTSSVKLGGVSYSQSASDQHVIEYHGYPETLVGISFAALRFKNKPFMPVITTIDGHAARLVEEHGGAAKVVFDAFGCPIWSITGYRVYRVVGYVGDLEAIGSLVSAAATNVPTEL